MSGFTAASHFILRFLPLFYTNHNKVTRTELSEMLMLWSSYRIKHSSALRYSWNCKYLGCTRNAFWRLLKSRKGSLGNKILTCRKWLAWEVVFSGWKWKCSKWSQCKQLRFRNVLDESWNKSAFCPTWTQLPCQLVWWSALLTKCHFLPDKLEKVSQN